MFLQLRYIENLIVRIVQPIANVLAQKRYGAFPKRTKMVLLSTRAISHKLAFSKHFVSVAVVAGRGMGGACSVTYIQLMTGIGLNMHEN